MSLGNGPHGGYDPKYDRNLWSQGWTYKSDVEKVTKEIPINAGTPGVGFPAAPEIKMSVNQEGPNYVEEALAKKFSSLLKEGESLERAAKGTGSELKALLSMSEVRNRVTEIIENYTLPAQARKMWARAVANKILAETENVKGAEKIALEALKFIGSDPEVGLQQANTVTVNLDRQALDKLLAEPVTIDFAPEPSQAQIAAPETGE